MEKPDDDCLRAGQRYKSGKVPDALTWHLNPDRIPLIGTIASRHGVAYTVWYTHGTVCCRVVQYRTDQRLDLAE